MTRRLTAALGATTGDVVLQLGSTHPSTHGALRLHLELDGDVVVRADPEVGFLHRGAEKLFEVRDYRQIVVLANRHDWLSAFSNELGVVLAVERMLGTAVPERAVWLRTLLAEVNRVLNHLLFLGSYPLELGELSPALAAHSSREALQRVLEEASGGRVHDMLNRVGGLKEDVPEGWTGRLREALDGARATADVLHDALLGSEEFLARTTGVGVLAPEHVLSHGASGPVARASGVDLDLRRDDPYLAYAELGFGGERFPVVLGRDGDALARFRCLLEQVRVSLDLAHACLDGLPAGPVAVRMPKTVRAPEGSTYVWTENPLGTMGYLLVSRGATTPWRLAMRTASFGNVSVLPVLLPGTHLRDVVTVLASLFFVVGDIDK